MNSQSLFWPLFSIVITLLFLIILIFITMLKTRRLLSDRDLIVDFLYNLNYLEKGLVSKSITSRNIIRTLGKMVALIKKINVVPLKIQNWESSVKQSLIHFYRQVLAIDFKGDQGDYMYIPCLRYDELLKFDYDNHINLQEIVIEALKSFSVEEATELFCRIWFKYIMKPSDIFRVRTFIRDEVFSHYSPEDKARVIELYNEYFPEKFDPDKLSQLTDEQLKRYEKISNEERESLKEFLSKSN